MRVDRVLGDVLGDGMPPSPPINLPGHLRPAEGFEAVSSQVLAYLRATDTLDTWLVTRIAGGVELVIASTGPTREIPIRAGLEFPFEHTVCRRMLTGSTGRIVPDVRSTAVLEDPVAFADAHGMVLHSYAGTPIVRPDGSLFGTLCGLGSTRMPEHLEDLEPLLELMSALLSSALKDDTVLTAAVREVEKARRESEVDALTGLLNRRGWDRLVKLEERRFQQYGDPASVIMLDLDGLKQINDTEGHEAGDRYLQRAATVLVKATRNTDVVARLGGDEFGVIAVDTSPQQAEVLVQRLDQRLNAAGVSTSVGHAPFTVLAGFPGAQRAADAMMYERKRQRRPLLPSPRSADGQPTS